MADQKNSDGKTVNTNTTDYGCITIDVAADQKKAPASKPAPKNEGEA